MIQELRGTLRDLSIQLAFDDFGEGQTRIIELGEVRPDFLKFDMGLTRAIHKASADRQKVVSMLAKMVNELGIISLAEGVESIEDHQVLTDMGFQLGQGFFYGRPAAVSKYAPGPNPAPPT
jgi:EAL domain-containing protein (putative c-di-GMP-specific phosphodiesterase class I)